jgi:hypothetical protein
VIYRRTQELLNEARRTREQSRRLRLELRKTIAQSMVLMWHCRLRRPPVFPSSANDLATRAERAKRNRETVVHTPPTPARPL